MDVIRDSSDSNPRFFDLMLAGYRQSALYIEYMKLSSTNWYRLFSYFLHHK